MPSIQITVLDDHGDPLAGRPDETYVLDGPCDTLDQIEAAVEKFKNTALPALENTLLSHSQARFVEEAKKGVETA